MSSLPPCRSWLFAPGNHARRVEKALAGEAQAVILDLEDAVALSEKVAARADVRKALESGRPNSFVRINALGTNFAFEDVEEVMPGRPTGIMLPKAERADEVGVLDWLLSQHERRLGIPDGATQIVPLVETALGVANAASVARCSPRIRQLAFGAGDFTLDMGLEWSRDETELAGFRLGLVLASRAAGIAAPIDAVWVKVDDQEGMALSARRAKDHGFQGKLCIHPEQVRLVQAAYRPDEASIADAQEVVAAFAAAEASGAAAIRVGGRLIDYPIVEAARRTLADAARENA